MSNEIDGMKIVISADVSQAIRTLQDFQNKFRSMANQINGTMVNANVNINQFTDSISDIGNVTQIAQMSKMTSIIKDMNAEQVKNFLEMNKDNDIKKKLQEEALSAIKRQDKSLEKNKKSWLAVGVVAAAALYGIIRMSSLANMWMSELSGIFTLFIDSALGPLSPLIEGALNIFWQLSDWFSGLDPIIQGIIGVILLFGSAIVGISAAWVLLGPLIIPIIETIGAIIAGLLSPVALVVAAIIAVVAIAWYLYNNWDEVIASIGKLWDWLSTKISNIWEGIKTYLSSIWEGLKNTVSTAWDYIKSTIVNAIQGAYDTIVKIVDKIKNVILSVPGVKSAINIIQGGYQTAKSYLGYAQGTDYVPATGLYKLHEGEKVIPKGGSNTENNQSVVFNVTNNINNPNITSNIDIRNLASQLSNFWRDDMQRFTRGVV